MASKSADLTRGESIAMLVNRVKRLRKLSDPGHGKPPPNPQVVIMAINAEVNVHEAIEKLRAALEKQAGPGEVVNQAQIDQIVKAIKET